MYTTFTCSYLPLWFTALFPKVMPGLPKLTPDLALTIDKMKLTKGLAPTY